MRGSAKKDRHVTFQNNGSQLLDIPHAVAIESGKFFLIHMCMHLSTNTVTTPQWCMLRATDIPTCDNATLVDAEAHLLMLQTTHLHLLL